jgi:hypothetical protein
MNLDLKRLIKNYGGRWVALNENSSRVIASGRKAQKVYDAAKKKGSETPKLYKVPKRYLPYIGR